MKRRRRYGEKYSGLPYPEDFKNKMVALFPKDQELKRALGGGWYTVGKWFNELCSYQPSLFAGVILEVLEQDNAISILRKHCEAIIQRRKELKALKDEWQRIVYLDDQGCKPWKEEG